MYAARFELGDDVLHQAAAELVPRSLDAARPVCSLLWNFHAHADCGIALRWTVGGSSQRLLLRAHSRCEEDLKALQQQLESSNTQLHFAETRERFDELVAYEPSGALRVGSGPLRGRGHLIFFDSLLVPHIDLLSSFAASRNTEVCYQLDLVAPEEQGEDFRALRKDLVRLEEDGAVPRSVVEYQRNALKRRIDGALPSEEYVACDAELAEDLRSFLDAAIPLPHVAFSADDVGLQPLNEAQLDQLNYGLHAAFFDDLAYDERWSAVATRDDLTRVLEVAVMARSAALAQAPVPSITGEERQVDVFISHSSTDRLAAEAVCDHLEGAGIRCWIAPRNILEGDIWAESIMRGINAAKLTVVLVSPSASTSPYVLREMEHATQCGKRILPVRLSRVDSTGGLHFFVSVNHWLDAVSEPFERHLPLLLEAVRSQLGRRGDGA